MLWLLGIFFFLKWFHCSHAIQVFLHDLPWQCCDFSALFCCPIKERLHINLVTAIVRKEHFFFLIKPVLAFYLRLKDFQYMVSFSVVFFVFLFLFLFFFFPHSYRYMERIRKKMSCLLSLNLQIKKRSWCILLLFLFKPNWKICLFLYAIV